MWILSYVAITFFSFIFFCLYVKLTPLCAMSWTFKVPLWKLATVFGSVPLIQSTELPTEKIIVYFLAIKTLIWLFYIIPVYLLEYAFDILVTCKIQTWHVHVSGPPTVISICQRYYVLVQLLRFCDVHLSIEIQSITVFLSIAVADYLTNSINYWLCCHLNVPDLHSGYSLSD